MKSFLPVLFVVVGLLISGCTVEKRMIIRDTEPGDLFIRTQAIIREHLPTAKVTLDADKRYIKAVDSRNMDYPTLIELRFNKDGGDTLLHIKASGDQQRLENLGYILSDGLAKKSIEKLSVKDRGALREEVQPREGHAVVDQRDLEKDYNKDGWVSPQEERIFNQEQLLELEKRKLEK